MLLFYSKLILNNGVNFTGKTVKSTKKIEFINSEICKFHRNILGFFYTPPNPDTDMSHVSHVSILDREQKSFSKWFIKTNEI